MSRALPPRRGAAAAGLRAAHVRGQEPLRPRPHPPVFSFLTLPRARGFRTRSVDGGRPRHHPRRHNPGGPGAPIPGDAVDGVVVAAPAPQGISSELGALAALHQKGALTDGEFAAAKAKLLG